MTYSESYYFNLLKNYSATAEQICKIRWDWIMQTDPKVVLDFGCGVGWMTAFAPSGVVVDSIDEMPVPQTGIRHHHYDALILADVVEHIANPDEVIAPLLAKSAHAFVTLPIIPQDKPWHLSKHWKPYGEHLVLPSEEQVLAFFKHYGFDLLRSGSPECPPRVDVMSFMFEGTKVKRGEVLQSSAHRNGASVASTTFARSWSVNASATTNLCGPECRPT